MKLNFKIPQDSFYKSLSIEHRGEDLTQRYGCTTAE